MKRFLFLSLSLVLLFSLSGIASATNGDNLIAIGPIARSMGGVGIAAPQDAISAVFSNPAAMCFGPYCPGSEFNFAGTIFMPKAKTRIADGGIWNVSQGSYSLDTGWVSSDSDLFAIPAIGISSPITQNLRFGIAAYGVSGLGVDYRDKFDLFPDTYFGGMPASIGTQDIFTNLQIMKFAPNLAYMITPNFSVGAAIHINYAALDLGDGTSSDFSFGAQLGAIYKNGPLSIGATYVSAQKASHKNVFDMDFFYEQMGRPPVYTKDTLDLESPQQIGAGIAYEIIPSKLLVEGDVKWLNWSDADGYDDFDWRDQWVYNIGIQYKPMPNLAIRAGYNYGRNPVVEHNNWEGLNAPPVNVQGKNVPRYQYELLRISGFPAIVEHHITFGIGYQITKSVSVDLGYMHAFKNSIKEKGTNDYCSAMQVGEPCPAPVTIESSLYEDSLEFGITWRF